MIPTKKQLKKKIKKEKITIEKKPYFSLVKEFLELQNKFTKPYFEMLPLIFEMIVYPIYVVYQCIMGDFSPFYIISLVKAYESWLEYFRFIELQKEIYSWIPIVKKVGGPWISTNNGDYHLYVYADAMERMLTTK